MKDPNDELDEAIDRNLREAYRQVHFRQEWCDRVLCEVANERQVARNSYETVASSVLPSRGSSSHLTGPRIAALAAGLLLAAAWISWLVRSPDRQAANESNGSTVSSSTGNPTSQNSKIVQPEPVIPPEEVTSGEMNGNIADSVVGGEGYLAAKLSDDSKFEIYVVLPKQKTSERH